MNLPAGNIEVPRENTEGALAQVITLLKAKDDTSRFVGLSLLHSLLDSRKDLREAPQVILQSWRAIPKSFLLRLLETAPSTRINAEDARNMKQLAVAVIHSYANMLSAQELGSKVMVESCEPLIFSLPDIEPTSQMLVFQTLQCIGVAPSGAASLLALPVLRGEFLDFAGGNSHHLQEAVRLIRILRVSGPLSREQVSHWDSLVLSLIMRLKDEPAQVFEMLTDVMNSPEVSCTI
jgi:Neurochondrin